MHAGRLLAALTNEELYELHDALPAEFETRGLEPPAASPAVGAKDASLPGDDTETRVATADAHATPDTRESLTDQLSSAYAGYRTVTTQLNEDRRRKEPVPVAKQETAAGELTAWLTDDKLAFVARAQEADPTLHFTLIATPNVWTEAKELAAMAREFGTAQPHQTYVWDELYSMYTPAQLSGADPGSGMSVVFSLIPSKMDERLYGTVQRQREVLADMRAATPALHVPSVLESIVYWQTLRARDDRLDDSAAFDATYVRHFDLPPQRIGDFQGIPSSCGGGGGGPSLSYSRVGLGGPGRVAVGARAAPSSHPGE
jgi:hypothetical protein